MKVLICGAGPTGLTAGVELARRGVEVTVFEKRTAPSPLSRAVGINPESLQRLEPSGVTAALLAEGVSYRGLVLYRGDRVWTTLDFDAARPERFGRRHMFGLPQDRTEAILAAALERHGGTLRRGCEVTGVAQDEGGVRVTLSDGSEARGGWLVGADGTHSRVREAVAIGYPGHRLPDVWSIADIDAPGWPHRDRVALALLPEGRLAAVVPLGGARVRMISNTEDALAAEPFGVTVAARHDSGQFRVALRMAERFRAGRVLLAGDAAHSHSPAGGRGMNLGIADACELAERLVVGEIDGYGAARRRADARIIAGAERMRRVVTARSHAARLATLGLLRLATTLPPLRARLASNFLYG
ncbi:FAD-dependent oxidoreductase [Limimaricola pyoseonensis]|uniref:2-polyprenyl-6-methoxyphenol hydroxylase n=1 Tax=Limimaricola pyoseonensis TaxID=521013 RepID=A0A1G7H0K1_9RHOB|nr:FAD-dependent monooxygenase [Limimaricola pyoseonensis]SDE93833.1 2-polyprenyl-6-methoxyphenol hydroxylase [Limimaricola pyoseonensis]